MDIITEVYIVNMALEQVNGPVFREAIRYSSHTGASLLDKRDIHVFVINVDNDTYEKIRKTFRDMVVNPGLPNDLVCGFKSVLRAMIANAGKYGLTFYDIWPRDITVCEGDADWKIKIPIDTTVRPCEQVETLSNIDGKYSMAMYYHSEQLYSDHRWKGATFDKTKCDNCPWGR